MERAMENIDYNKLREAYMDAVRNGKDYVYLKGVGKFAKEFIHILLNQLLKEMQCQSKR